MDRSLSAPGKLFVSGEYAVLWGGVARVAAVGPRAHAYVRRREDTDVHLVLEEGRLKGAVTPLGAAWEREVPQGFRFAARAVDEVLKAHGTVTLGFTLAMAPTPRPSTGAKLGLGSSARAALLAAEAARYILEERVDPLKVALVAHALAQSLRGSGGDVAAIYAGGLIRYRRFPVEEVAGRGAPRAVAYREAPPVDLVRVTPKAWHALYVQAGEAASTPRLIASAEERLDEAARARFVEESDALGEDLEAALVGRSFPFVAEAVGALRELLRKAAPEETEGTRRALALAQAHGCSGKPSGAGGGDGCIVFCPDAGAQKELLEAYAARQVLAFPVPLEPGLRGEAQADPRLLEWAGA